MIRRFPRDRATFACYPFKVMVRASRKPEFLDKLRSRCRLVRALLVGTPILALALLLLLGGCSSEAPERLEIAAAKARSELATLNAMEAETATKLESAQSALKSFTDGVTEPELRAKRQQVASLLGNPSALLSQVAIVDRALSDYLVFQQVREDRGWRVKRAWLKQLDRHSDDLRKRMERVSRSSLAFKRAIDELNRINSPLNAVDRAISEATILQRDGDSAIREVLTLIHLDRPTPPAEPSMAQRIRVALTKGMKPNCNDDCQGGATCFSGVKRPWWCGDSGCSCDSGLACLDGPAESPLPPGKALRLRFSNLRRTNEDDLCKPPLTEAVCVRAPGRAWHCFTREDACARRTHYLGPHSSESMTISTDDLTNVGLDITLWTDAPVPDQIDELLTATQKPSTLFGISQKAETRENGVRNVALCNGLHFEGMGIRDQQPWNATFYITPIEP
jgi:hypothetical protein